MIRHLILRNLAKTSAYHSESGAESTDSGDENDNEATAPFAETGLDTSQTKDIVTMENEHCSTA